MSKKDTFHIIIKKLRGAWQEILNLKALETKRQMENWTNAATY